MSVSRLGSQREKSRTFLVSLFITGPLTRKNQVFAVFTPQKQKIIGQTNKNSKMTLVVTIMEIDIALVVKIRQVTRRPTYHICYVGHSLSARSLSSKHSLLLPKSPASACYSLAAVFPSAYYTYIILQLILH